jgi:hypothetical protein
MRPLAENVTVSAYPNAGITRSSAKLKFLMINSGCVDSPWLQFLICCLVLNELSLQLDSLSHFNDESPFGVVPKTMNGLAVASMETADVSLASTVSSAGVFMGRCSFAWASNELMVELLLLR